MMIDNLHDITVAETVLWNVVRKSSVSIQFEAHGSYFAGIKGFSDRLLADAEHD